MKKIASIVCTFLLGSFLITSCQREIENPNIAETNFKLISEFVSLDTTKAVPLDTVDREIFLYDANKRLTKVALIIYDPLTGPDTNHAYTFFYQNSNDTLPSRLRFQGLSNGSEVMSYLSYDSQGRIVKDSMIGISGAVNDTVVKKYTYQSGYVQSDIRVDYMGFSQSISRKSWQTIVGGNVTAQYDTLFPTATDPGYIYLHNATYDNHPNPHGFFNKIILGPVLEGGAYTNGFVNNSLTSRYEQKSFPGGTTLANEQYIDTYAYDADGYPKFQWVRDLSSSAVAKYFFKYQ